MDRMMSGGETAPSLAGKCQKLRITSVDHPAQLDQIDAGLVAAFLSISNDCIQGTEHRLIEESIDEERLDGNGDAVKDRGGGAKALLEYRTCFVH
jgi:hypothetical protein